MARGIGTLTVAVQANSAKAVKNLRDFRSEMKATGRDARQMSSDFRGNTLGDFMNRFGPKKPQIGGGSEAAAMKDLNRTVVDLRKDTARYRDVLGQVGPSGLAASSSLKTMNVVMKGVGIASKALGLVGLTITVAQLGLELYRNKNAWQDWGTSIGRTLGLIEEEGQRADEILGRKLDAKLAAQQQERKRLADDRQQQKQMLEQERADAKAAAQRQRDVAVLGEDEVNYRENVKKFGLTSASIIQEDLDAVKTVQAQRDAAAAKEEARRQKEKAYYDNLRQDAEAVQSLRERVADFGKTSLQAERDQLLRTIEDVKQQGEVRKYFRDLEKQQAQQDAIERLKSQRQSLAGRDQSPAMLDARTAEGWAALRKSIGDPQIAKLDEQIALMREANRLAADKPKEEVFSL